MKTKKNLHVVNSAERKIVSALPTYHLVIDCWIVAVELQLSHQTSNHKQQMRK